MNSIEEIYNPENLLNEIKKYRKIDLKNEDFNKVCERFEGIINQFHHVCANIGSVPIFRVRSIARFKSHKKRSDLWCPPPDLVTKMGRLNDINESIFYAAFDPITAIKESRIKKGDKFSLAVFYIKFNTPYNLSTINLGIPKPLDKQTKSERIFTMILNDFMFSEFTRHVGLGTEFQYKTSCAIGKLLFKIPHKDSIIYPSMIDYTKRNIAFSKSGAEKRIELNDILKCKLKGYDSDSNPILHMTRKGIYSKDTDTIKYEKTPKAQRIFTLKLETYFKEFNPYKDLINKIDDYK